MRDMALLLVQPHHLLLYVFAYGLASLPTSYGVAKIISGYEVNRKHPQSHSATFMWKNISPSSAVLVLVLDILKGLIPCAIALSLDVPPLVIALIGVCAVSGHCFSVMLAFSGGHGGATFAGVLMIIAMPAAVVCMLTNYVMIMLKVDASLASLIGALVGAVLVLFLVDASYVWFLVMVMVVIIAIRHFLGKEIQ